MSWNGWGESEMKVGWGGGCVSEWVVCAAIHLRNSTGHRMTMVAPLLLTSGMVRYEAVLHGCGTRLKGFCCCCCLHPSNI